MCCMECIHHLDIMEQFLNKRMRVARTLTGEKLMRFARLSMSAQAETRASKLDYCIPPKPSESH